MLSAHVTSHVDVMYMYILHVLVHDKENVRMCNVNDNQNEEDRQTDQTGPFTNRYKICCILEAKVKRKPRATSGLDSMHK